ncbi:thioredoxin-disulfide reductase [Candidatus Falkowbacteria bacterium]|nr:MAG: thioredoxin-disulfide reductase [Candidatus Falkowbacteria bacterium]
MYDTIIIGSGPAGLTAGIYAARREMKALIIGKELGGQIMWASEIENYPGFSLIKADELVNKIKKQVDNLGVEIKTGEIKEIKKEKNKFTIYTQKEIFKSKTIIIAMGLQPRRLNIPGEIEFNGRGVTYCANCDGPFYREKNVVVVGGGNSALDAAEVLSKIAKKVYLVHRREEFRGFEVLVDEVKSKKNIELILNSEIKEIKGDLKVEKVITVNLKEKKEKELIVDGVFIEIGRIAHTDLVAKLVDRNEQGQIIIDSQGRTLTPGLFAAGDVVNSAFKQLTIAMGSATTAALSAYQYLQLQSGKGEELIIDRSLPR